MKTRWLFIGFLMTLFGCCPMEESEKDKLRKLNETTERIYRLDNEHFFHTNELIIAVREPYPWEPKSNFIDKKITKEYFRCKGSSQNVKRILTGTGEQKKEIQDCGGIDKHGLPYKEEGEYIYPALIDLVNYVQEKLGKRVVITTGHRCPQHNEYADPSKINRSSKHQIGAEVDFYVEGHEESPYEVVRWIMHYYSEHPELGFSSFRECRHNPLGLSHAGWYNEEVIVTVKQKHEGRDFDNRHPYPYITLELRCDRDQEGKPIEYNWQKANNNYIRF